MAPNLSGYCATCGGWHANTTNACHGPYRPLTDGSRSPTERDGPSAPMASEDTRKVTVTIGPHTWVQGSDLRWRIDDDSTPAVGHLDNALDALAETAAALGRAQQERDDVERVENWWKDEYKERHVHHNAYAEPPRFEAQDFDYIGMHIIATAPTIAALGAALREAEQATTKEGEG